MSHTGPLKDEGMLIVLEQLFGRVSISRSLEHAFLTLQDAADVICVTLEGEVVRSCFKVLLQN